MITIVLDGLTLPEPNTPFIQKPVEIAKDVLTLAGNRYTDFSARSLVYELNYIQLHEDDYNDIWAIYISQFEEFNYPLLTISEFDITNYPTRMEINDKDIRQDGCYMRNVTITLTLAAPVS